MMIGMMIGVRENGGDNWKECYHDFQQGYCCPKCAGLLKHTLEFVKEEYKKRSYEFLDDYYKNSGYNHNIRCHCGHVWKQNYNKLKQGVGCRRCSYNDRKTNKVKDFENNFENISLLDFDADLLSDLIKKACIFNNSIRISGIGGSQLILSKLQEICNKKISNTDDLKECFLIILKKQSDWCKTWVIKKTIGYYHISSNKEIGYPNIKKICMFDYTNIFSKILDCCDFLEYKIKDKRLEITKGTLLLDGEWVVLGD